MDYAKFRREGFYGVLINLRLTWSTNLGRLPATLPNNADNGVRIASDQFELAVGLPLYDAAGSAIDLRRYSVLSAIGGNGLKPAAELLTPLLPPNPDT